MPAGLRALWSEACGWVGWLFGVFARDALRTRGVSRETGARLGVWLMDIESAVRRLILAAALAFMPPARRTPACADARTQTAATSPRRPGFCVFRLAASSEAAHRPDASASTTPGEAKPYGHVHFPTDPLLRLGAKQQRTTHMPRNNALPTRNPLDRWVRLSRHDPDWRPSEDIARPYFRPTLHAAPSRTKSARAAHNPEALPDSLHDWRRRHDEWRKQLPAPDLAARLETLQRIASDPSAAITSAARRLRQASDKAHPRAYRAAIITTKPRRSHRNRRPHDNFRTMMSRRAHRA